MLMEFIKEEDGQALSEYGLVLGIIVIAAIVVLTALKDQIVAMFQNVVDAFKGISGTT